MSHTYKYWTAEEDQTLRDMFAAGASDGEIAKALGRTTSSVWSRRRDSRLLRYHAAPRKPWTCGEIKRLKRLVADGKKPKEISRELGRTVKAVYYQLYLIKK